jgi:hypothetical protein
MGMVLAASCPCGFEDPYVPFGGVMLNFQTSCSAPARCGHCHRLTSVDVLSPESAPCHPDDVELLAQIFEPATTPPRGSGPSPEGPQHWDWRLPDDRTVRVSATGNRCPACGQPTLTFRVGYMID